MAVRYQAQCRRAVPRVASTPSPAIWVTDNMLRQAIARYQRRTSPQRRRLSSHTGPVESRRKLGKRHMTGMMPTTAYNQKWHFDVIPTMTGWQWQAPTTREQRKNRKKDMTVSAMFNDFIGWLEKSDADKPFLTPPPDASSLSMPTEAESSNLYAPFYVPQEITQLRTSIMQAATIDAETLSDLARTCQSALKSRVLHGKFSAEEMLSFMAPLDAASQEKLNDRRLVNLITSQAQHGVISAMAKASKASAEIVPDSLWLTLASFICWKNGTNQDIKVFTKLMKRIPEHIKINIPPTQVFNLFQGRLAALAASANSSGRWLAQSETASVAFQHLTDAQKQTLNAQLAAWLEISQSGHESSSFQFAWLVVRAYDPSMSQANFLQAYHEIATTLNDTQHFQLLFARLQSLNLISPDHHATLTNTRFASMSHRWSALIQATAPSSIPSLYQCIADMNLQTTVINHLVASPTARLQMQSIRAIATHCNNHEFAIALYDALVAKHHGIARRLKWQTWSNHIEAIIADTVSEKRIWQLLSITRPSISTVESEVDQKLQLIDRMAAAYASSTHFSNRQLLRRLESCARAQRIISGRVSDSVIIGIMNVVIKDLEQGGRGRSTRMEWLVGLVEENQGKEQAQEVAAKLRGWRWVIEQETTTR